MRKFYAVSLACAGFLGMVFWYQSTALQCPVPVYYRLGQLDEQFGLSPEEAKDQLRLAEAVWEEAAGRDLFVYSDRASFTVDFTYDERQGRTTNEVALRSELDAKRLENEALFTQVSELQDEFNRLSADYNERAASYESELETYNSVVASYNDNNGAPPEVFAELEQERRALMATADELSLQGETLETVSRQIATLVERSQTLNAEYNRQVTEYNRQFGYTEEFVQGDYRADGINIYSFATVFELQTVLVHEFGHALGIDHVADPTSVMYYLLKDSIDTPALSALDVEALTAVCGTAESFSQSVRSAIRTFLHTSNIL